MVSLLLQYCPTVDIQDAHGNTPLWRAVYNSRGREDIIQMLLGAGADKNHRNKHGKTPFQLAATIANYNIVQFLE
jgi:ankyrin repeat protein